MIVMLIYGVMFLFETDTEYKSIDTYRIVERRITGCDSIDYIPEKRGEFSNCWLPVEYEYSKIFQKSFPKTYNSLHEAKNAIKEDMKEDIKEKERSVTYKGYEKIHRV